MRKGLFSGLTLLLISVFIYLVIQGNRLEKERLQRDADVVETFQPTPVRSLQPDDLEITAASMEPESFAGNGGIAVARHRVEIRNSGEATYCEIRFKLDYLDAGGKKLKPVFQEVPETVPPGMTGLALEIPQNEIPAGAVDCIPSIVYADIKPEDP